MGTIDFERAESRLVVRNPLRGFAAEEQRLEVRRDPLLGGTSVLNPFLASKAGFFGTNDREFIARLVEQSAASCVFCGEALARKTAMYPEDLVPGGRLARGEATLLPNLFALAAYHPLVVLSRAHFLELEGFTPALLADGLGLAREFLRHAFHRDRTVPYAFVGANYLLPAGASIVHPHLQMLVSPVPYGRHERLLDACRAHDERHGGSLLQDLADEEERLGARSIGRRGGWRWSAAFAPQGCNEILAVHDDGDRLRRDRGRGPRRVGRGHFGGARRLRAARPALLQLRALLRAARPPGARLPALLPDRQPAEPLARLPQRRLLPAEAPRFRRDRDPAGGAGAARARLLVSAADAALLLPFPPLAGTTPTERKSSTERSAMRHRTAVMGIIAVLLAAALTPPPAAASPGPAGEAARLLDRSPLLFVENRGQLDPAVRYLLPGRDKSVAFTDGGITVLLSPDDPAAGRWAARLDFLGAAEAAPAGEERAPAVMSWFSGGRDNWKSGVPTWRRLVYRDLWPGIDLEYAGEVGMLKYRFLVRPGADPDAIRMAWRGVSSVAVDAEGRLQVSTPAGGFADETPAAWQVIDGRREPVRMAFALAPGAASDAGFGFSVGEYDRSRELVLDPGVVVTCGYLGSNGEARGVALDGDGNAYVTGFTFANQTGFPVTGGPDLTGNGNTDAFVAKIAPDGSLVWAGFIGGASWDQGRAIAVDSVGAAYIAGNTSSAEGTFPAYIGPGPDLRRQHRRLRRQGRPRRHHPLVLRVPRRRGG